MRITNDHSCSPTTHDQRRVASTQTENGFASSLASAVEANESESDGPAPEFSAATYRLFAAIDLERGDTKHAALHLSRVPDAREAGLPLQPTGLLSAIGRWDYTEAAAALPQTGRFDSATGQGEARFIPYNATHREPAGDDCAPTETAAADTPTPSVRGTETTADRTSPARRIVLRDGLEELLDV